MGKVFLPIYSIASLPFPFNKVLKYEEKEKKEMYGAQNEAYMSRSAEKWVRGLCFNELGVSG